MWNTVLLCENVTYLCLSIPQVFPTKVFLLRPCCGSSCSVHPTVVYVRILKKSISQSQPFSSNIKKRKQDIDVLSTKLQDTLAYTAGKKQNNLVSTVRSVHVSAARCHWDRLHLVLPLSAVYVSVKYWPNTETVWPQLTFLIYHNRDNIINRLHLLKFWSLGLRMLSLELSVL